MGEDGSTIASRTRSQCRMRSAKAISDTRSTPTKRTWRAGICSAEISPSTPISRWKTRNISATTPTKNSTPHRTLKRKAICEEHNGDAMKEEWLIDVPSKRGRAGRSSESFREVNEIHIPVKEEFSLAQAICSYGFFLMEPNDWIPGELDERGRPTGSFKRKLRCGLNDELCCGITVSQPSDVFIRVTYDAHGNSNVTRQEIEKQVKRMCRLDALSPDLEGWWRINEEAKARRFGYLFRSPTLWEDMVKTITICNTRWKQSCRMNQLLCSKISSYPGSFPSPWDVIRFTGDELQKLCYLGYRGVRVFKLASAICDGSLDLQWFEAFNRPQEEIYKALLKMYGIGTFAANNILQLLGYYQSEPYDSETVRLFRQTLKVKGVLSEVCHLARARYTAYKPYQFLAYWFELWKNYESIQGKWSTCWIPKETNF